MPQRSISESNVTLKSRPQQNPARRRPTPNMTSPRPTPHCQQVTRDVLPFRWLLSHPSNALQAPSLICNQPQKIPCPSNADGDELHFTQTSLQPFRSCRLLKTRLEILLHVLRDVAAAAGGDDTGTLPSVPIPPPRALSNWLAAPLCRRRQRCPSSRSLGWGKANSAACFHDVWGLLILFPPTHTSKKGIPHVVLCLWRSRCEKALC